MLRALHRFHHAGGKTYLLRIYHGVSEDRILAISAGVTFFVLLAIFPAIAGLIALYGLYADPQTISQHLAAAAGVLPEGGLQIIREQVERLTSQPSQRLGLATLIGLAVALWSANGGMKAMFDALNVVYHEKEKRGFVRLNAISLTFTLGAMLFVTLALTALTVLPAVLNSLGLSRAIELLVKVGSLASAFSWGKFCNCPNLSISARAGTNRNGVGSHQAAYSRQRFGLQLRCCFLGTPRTSASTMKRMARLALR